MKNKVFLIAIGIIAVFAISFYFLKQNIQPAATTAAVPNEASEAQQQFQMVPMTEDLLIKPHSITKGPADAKVTVVEYLDPECEGCAAMAPVFKKITDEFKSDIKVVVRYMTYHKNSKYVANILEGARAQNKFWETLELLFQTQDQWANHHNPNPDLIPEILKPLKMNLNQIIADAKAGKYDKQIEEDVEDGRKLNVRGTPTFFVNGHQVPELGYEPLKAAIVEKLAQ